MTNLLSRRAVVRAFPFIGAAAAVAVGTLGDILPARAESAVADDKTQIARIERLIDRHQKAWLAFEASCPASDRMEKCYGGPAAEAKNDRLSAIEQRALIALLAEPATTRWASNRKGTYLITTLHGRWLPDTDNVGALLSSLL